MGIMHKLLIRRDLECQALIMDLTKSKDINNKFQQQQTEDSDIQEDDLVPKLATDDNQFTAEHIVQLCKFLAKKSKRNKKVHKPFPASHNSSKLKFRSQYQRESNSHSHLKQEIVETVNQVPHSRLHDSEAYVMATATSTPHILSDKLICNSNVCEDLNQKNFSATNKHQCAQEKRDILLKIRHQIFERKRQRQLVEQQLDVWRPW